MSSHWQIIATDEYIEQVGKLPLGIQNNIQQKWIEVAQHDNPREVGATADCGKDEEECPYIVVVFAGLAFEFIYKIDKANRTLTLINCKKLPILDHGQT